MSKRKNHTRTTRTTGDYEVGYGKPPRSGQFKPGQSGNPKGAPKKARTQLPPPSDLRPTAAAIRKEGARLIPVREGDTRQYISTTTAVMRALAIAAVKQGPMAMREYLKVSLEEDERHLRERRRIFDSWRYFKESAMAAISAARRSGRKPPDFLPHPDDVELDFDTLSVRLLGPIDEEGRKACEHTMRLSELLFQLMIYHGEDNQYCAEKPLDGKLGIFGLLYWQAILSLPPRLRIQGDDFHAEIERRLCLPQRHWEALLTKECVELGLSFSRRRADAPSFALRALFMKLDPDKQKAAAMAMRGSDDL